MTLVIPLERRGHRLIKVIDEGEDTLLEFVSRLKTGVLEQPSYQDAEPN